MAGSLDMSDGGMKQADKNALEQFLCFGVYSTGLAFNRVYKPVLEKIGLTYPQYLAIVLLRERDGQTIGELGEALFLESSTLTPLVKRMEAAGIVTRRRDSADERVVRVSLTEKGRGIAAEAACVPEQILAATGLSEEQLAVMQKAMVRLRDTLRAHAE